MDQLLEGVQLASSTIVFSNDENTLIRQSTLVECIPLNPCIRSKVLVELLLFAHLSSGI
jgi:hypothetical protein